MMERRPNPSSTIDPSRSRVLIVDDSEDLHRLLRARLKHDELEFESAYHEQEAFEKACSWSPELILLDLSLPSEDGLVLLRRLKDDARTRDIPVIVLSAHQAPRYKVAAFDMGAVDYVTKPFELIELRVRIRSSLRMHQLIQMLAQRAQVDGLTGLWNRTFFDKRWQEEYSRCQRHGHPLSVAMLDIDYFKSINDNYGHPMGDQVLQSIARILRQNAVRESDLACRYGGEEFVIVMPDTNAIEAAVVCERIRQAVAEARWARTPDMRVTASVGVVGASGPVKISAEQWVELCDKNLYNAKHSGRNRVVVTDLAGTTTLSVRHAA
jgi:diguanylate cyclase (GGDEF)-like protein